MQKLEQLYEGNLVDNIFRTCFDLVKQDADILP